MYYCGCIVGVCVTLLSYINNLKQYNIDNKKLTSYQRKRLLFPMYVFGNLLDFIFGKASSKKRWLISLRVAFITLAVTVVLNAMTLILILFYLPNNLSPIDTFSLRTLILNRLGTVL